ncbi:hypothetical protein [Nocardioides ochotonae]|uniref:hypothetical protein n=1 Tax=Nocardioides ochotonae TaxID=2685869 RepID=UPI0014083BE2|nr:hypothetical protein [Nocardioides ochotonae]
MNTKASIARRGDICPSWCGGGHVDVREYDGRPAHPEDAGIYHRSNFVDRWQPTYGERLHEDFIEVRVEGKRHDVAQVQLDGEIVDNDFPDQITATNVFPGFLAEVGLDVPDARRLGEALIRACDLAEGRVTAGSEATT